MEGSGIRWRGTGRLVELERNLWREKGSEEVDRSKDCSIYREISKLPNTRRDDQIDRDTQFS